METKQSNGPFKISISTMRESHRVTYWVTWTNGLSSENLSVFKTRGTITPRTPEVFENVREVGMDPLTNLAPDVAWLLNDY
jgi:hypothetical protein